MDDAHDANTNNTFQLNSLAVQMLTFNKNKLLPVTLEHKNIIKSPAEINWHREMKLASAIVHDQTKNELYKICNSYAVIFSKHATDMAKHAWYKWLWNQKQILNP